MRLLTRSGPCTNLFLYYLNPVTPATLSVTPMSFFFEPCTNLFLSLLLSFPYSVTPMPAMKAAMSRPAKQGSIRLTGASGDTESIINGEYIPYEQPHTPPPPISLIIHHPLIRLTGASGDTKSIINGGYIPKEQPPHTRYLLHLHILSDSLSITFSLGSCNLHAIPNLS